MGQRQGAHGGLTGRGETAGDGALRSAPGIERESSRRQARVDGTAARERKGRAAVARPFERQSSDRPGFAWLGQLIDDFHHIGPDRPLPPRSECLGFPPRHVCAAERCLLLTYLLT